MGLESHRSTTKLACLVAALVETVAVQGCSNSSKPNNDKPAITNFSASPTTVQRGGTVRFTWTVNNADRIAVVSGSIQQDVTATNSLAVAVFDNTTFTLKAMNKAGEATASVAIGVSPDEHDGGIPFDGGTQLPPQLVYTDPPPGGKIRLVRDASASTSTLVVLNLVSNATLTGYSVGFDLPLAFGRVEPGTPLISPADEALNPGGVPQAVAAAIPPAVLPDGTVANGPLTNVLVTGMSQKAAGNGAVPNDAQISSGKLFYTVRLKLVDQPARGIVFDGSALGSKFRAEFRNKVGDVVASGSDFAIGKLVVQ